MTAEADSGLAETRPRSFIVPDQRALPEMLRESHHCAMSEVIQQAQLRNDNASVMRRVAAGESFVVTVDGRPVADVVPHRHDSRVPRFVPVWELEHALSAIPRPAPAAWRTDIAATDDPLGPDTPTDPFAEAGQ